jgi:tRNA G10  N-methylase Trm11
MRRNEEKLRKEMETIGLLLMCGRRETIILKCWKKCSNYLEKSLRLWNQHKHHSSFVSRASENASPCNDRSILSNLSVYNGPIDLKHPRHIFHVIEYHTIDKVHLTLQPQRIYFGEWMGNAQRRSMDQYSLKKRAYIGTTSMDAELSLIMANMAHVQPHSLVMDPFLGTGSLMVAAAHFGAWTMGTDIDPRVLRGKNGKNARTNFKQYGLSEHEPDLLVCDITRMPLRTAPLLDAILTDRKRNKKNHSSSDREKTSSLMYGSTLWCTCRCTYFRLFEGNDSADTRSCVRKKREIH